LLDDPRTPIDVRLQAASIYPTLDPVRLLQDIRACQQKLVEIADTPVAAEAGSSSAPTIDQFLVSLKTAWQEGQANPTTRAKPKIPRLRRRPDPLAAVSQQIECWFAAEPWRTSREFLIACIPNIPSSIMKGTFVRCSDGSKNLRRQAAQNLVLGSSGYPEAARKILDTSEKHATHEVADGQRDASRSLATAQWEARIASGLLGESTPSDLRPAPVPSREQLR
jgi:hypothetical protein